MRVDVTFIKFVKTIGAIDYEIVSIHAKYKQGLEVKQWNIFLTADIEHYKMQCLGPD